MSNQIIVPSLGESVTEATVSKWLKKVGEEVDSDEPIVELETDKVNVEVPSPLAGTLSSIKVKEGSTVAVGALLGLVKEIKSISENTPTEKPVIQNKKTYVPPKKLKKKNIIEEVFPETLKILSDLIKFQTVSGTSNIKLIDYCEKKLGTLGANSFRTFEIAMLLTLP